jgi:transcription factor SPN1
MADAEIEDMRRRMTDAAQRDAVSRREGKPAMHKLKMLPEVISLLNRNQYVNSLVDPEINLLEAVKFFLEPLDDGSLPAYNIQRDLMEALAKLPINKESLIASGIGKVIVFYTKSKRPEERIKRQAERLLAEWTRPILQRSDDYSKKVYEEVDFDPTYVPLPPALSIPKVCTHADHSTADNCRPARKCCRPRQQLQRLVPENFSHPVWPTVLVARWATLRTQLCRVRRWFRKASLPVPWVPVERIVSGR